MSRLSLIILASVGCVSTFLAEGQTGGSVLQLLVSLQADVNNVKAQLQEQQQACSCTGTTMKHTVAFMVTLGHAVIDCLSEHPVIFDNVKLNQNSVYDTRHGTFRAPVNGTYQISATLSAPPNHAGLHVAFVKNLASQHVGYLYADGNTDHWQERSTSLVLHLSAGDDVWISCLSNSMIWGNADGKAVDYHSHFSGFLIAED